VWGSDRWGQSASIVRKVKDCRFRLEKKGEDRGWGQSFNEKELGKRGLQIAAKCGKILVSAAPQKEIKAGRKGIASPGE